MKRSRAIDIICENGPMGIPEHAEEILDALEKAGMQPPRYIHPKAIEDFGDVIKEKGDHWGYIHYIDKYPEHHFLRGRPYEYYCEGWEPEDE